MSLAEVYNCFFHISFLCVPPAPMSLAVKQMTALCRTLGISSDVPVRLVGRFNLGVGCARAD